MTRIVPVLLGSIVTAAAYLVVSPGLLAAGICILLPSLLWLALRKRGIGVAILLALILAIGLGGALVLGPESPTAPLILGLPRRAALLIYGIGLLPGIILGALFAIGFDRVAMFLAGAGSLRDVIAFPKTTAARALFEGAPSAARESDLAALHIRMVP